MKHPQRYIWWIGCFSMACSGVEVRQDRAPERLEQETSSETMRAPARPPGSPCDYQGSTQGVCAGGGVTDDQGECVAPATFQAEEATCDGRDNDCDGEIDEGTGVLTLYRDADSDGFGTATEAVYACGATAGYVDNAKDCNDADAAVRPGVVDLKDWVDNDCDNVIDEDAGRNTPSVLTALHNRVRAAASPAPNPPLPPLVWDADVAAFAQARANELSKSCKMIHNPRRGNLGENLAKGGRSFTAEEVVQIWASEAAHYDLGRNRCARGKVCGHYTQIVWRTTTAFGCGMAECRSSPLPMTIWVCNYKPPGNWRGKRPY